MNVFDLNAKIGLDSSAFDKGLNGAESAIKSFGGVLGGIGKAAGTAVLGGIGALGTAATKITKDAVDSYGEYEQLVGGVETLFDTSADQILEYSKKAYATAGLSANDYLQTVISFSGALIQSAGRGAQQDTEALEAELDAQYNATKRTLEDEYDEVKKSWDKRVKEAEKGAAREALSEQRDDALKALKRSNEDKLAELKSYNKQLIAEVETANMTSVTTPESLERAAELADMAIQDMSDNSNKIGVSMESLQNAYQGFARQTFTMLDNLKLGYQGSKTEMERLLRDATAISGVEYDVKSYADIVEAIHIIQQNLNITGTTAKEASSTIQGSAKAVKAAWQNLVTGIADDNADVGQLIDDFFNSLIASADNMLPRIAKGINGVIKFFGKAIAKLPDIAKKYLPMVTETIQNLIPALVSVLPEVFSVGGQIVGTLVQAILDNFTAILSAGMGLVQDVITGITQALPTLLPAAASIIMAVATGIIQNLPTLVSAALQVIAELGKFLVDNVGSMIPMLVTFVKYMCRLIMDNAPTILQTAAQLVLELATGISEALPELIPAILDVILTIVDELTNPESMLKILDAALKLIMGLVQGIIKAIPLLIKSLPKIIENIIEFFEGAIPMIVEAGIQLLSSLVGALPTIIQAIVKVLPKIISKIVSGIIKLIPMLVEAGVKLFVAIIKDLPTIIKEIVKAIPEIIEGIIGAFGNIFNDMASVGEDIVKGLWEGIKGLGNWLWDKVSGWAGDLFGGIKDFFGIHSPSKKFAYIGENLSKGLGKGFIDEMASVEKDMIKSIPTEFDSPEISQVPYDRDFQMGMQQRRTSAYGVQTAESRNLTIILEVDKQKFARAVVDLSKLETQRQGRILFGV